MDRIIESQLLILHFPDTEEGKKELRKKISEARADMILGYLQSLSCSAEEKNKFLDQIIKEELESMRG